MMEVFHSGERAVHDLLSVQKFADSVGTMIQPTISKQFESFLNQQTVLMIGSMDSTGRVWSSFLAGDPGIIQVIGPDIVRINGRINEFDPLFSNIQHNKEVGILIIDFVSRIRIRINGVILRYSLDRQFEVKTEQVYGNCPKFIQARKFTYNPAKENVNKVSYHRDVLNKNQQDWIRNSDTFIIASSSSEGKMDISHKGGMPGFVHTISEDLLLFPDYPGNMLFNTLGNIVKNPNVGLLFFDFDTGDTLQLTGEAQIIWKINENIVSKFPGAQRLIQIQVAEVLQTNTSKSYQWEFMKYSPFNPK